MDTTLHQNRPKDTKNWTNLYLEPHNYQMYYVNIDLYDQYGISAAESQTFLRAKHPQQRPTGTAKWKITHQENFQS